MSLALCTADGSEGRDALEDSTESFVWRWELRDMKVVPKALQPSAKLRNKALQQVSSRLACLCLCYAANCTFIYSGCAAAQEAANTREAVV